MFYSLLLNAKYPNNIFIHDVPILLSPTDTVMFSCRSVMINRGEGSKTNLNTDRRTKIIRIRRRRYGMSATENRSVFFSTAATIFARPVKPLATC